MRGRRTIIGLVTCAVIGLGVGGYFLLAGGGKSASAASASPKASATAAATASATPSATASAAAPVEPATHCSYPASPPAARNVGVPPATPDSKATYRATIVTNRGNVVIDLLNAKATCTVNSFVYLAGKNYFSNTHCHRLTTSSIYVLQCGDPTGTGTGGPGYKFGSENLAGATYPQGTIAMAHPGGRPATPKTAASSSSSTEHQPPGRLHAVRHSRQRARNHPECGQGGHRQRKRPW